MELDDKNYEINDFQKNWIQIIRIEIVTAFEIAQFENFRKIIKLKKIIFRYLLYFSYKKKQVMKKKAKKDNTKILTSLS